MLKNTNRKLTSKQQLVINQLLIDPSLKRCAQVTDLSYNYVRQLVTKTHIIEVLEEARKRVAEKAEIDAAWVLRQQVKVYERCMQDAGEPHGKKDNDQDFFSITVRDPVTLEIVFQTSATLDGGNVQIHPPTGKYK